MEWRRQEGKRKEITLMENQFKKYITKTISPSQSLLFLLLGSYQRPLYDMDAAIKQSTAEDKAYQQNVAWLSRTSSNLVFRNCLFHAIPDQINLLGEFGHNHTSLRHLTVKTLRKGSHGVSPSGCIPLGRNLTSMLVSYRNSMKGRYCTFSNLLMTFDRFLLCWGLFGESTFVSASVWFILLSLELPSW